jgi:hypothetical protein
MIAFGTFHALSIFRAIVIFLSFWHTFCFDIFRFSALSLNADFHLIPALCSFIAVGPSPQGGDIFLL